MTDVLYSRDNGPICITHRLFCPESLGGLLHDFFSSGMTWCWESERTAPVDDPASQDLPASRPLTMLTRTNARQFVRELLERNVDGYMRGVGVFGLENPGRPAPDKDSLRKMIADFEVHESGPLRIVIIQVSDMAFEYIFVPRGFTRPLEQLFRSWEIDIDTIEDVRPYKTLRLSTLEKMYPEEEHQ